MGWTNDVRPYYVRALTIFWCAATLHVVVQGYLTYGTATQRVPSRVATSANRQGLAVEQLWTVRNGDRSFGAALVVNHRSFEVRFVGNGHWFASQSVGSRELAVLVASVIQDDLLADGWVPASSEVHAS